MSGMDKTAEKFFLESLNVLTSAIEERDPWLKGRPQLVAGLCVHLAQALRLSQDEIKIVYLGALLHDFGLIYLPDELLGRSRDLSPREQAAMARHPQLALKVLAGFSPLNECLPIIRHHHEAFDGSGFPDRLKGQAIPLGARIVAVVDGLYELSAPRAGEPLDELSALEWLASDSRFDPELVNVLADIVKAGSQPVKPEATERQQAQARKTILEIVGRFLTGDVDLPVLPNLVSRIQELIDSPVSTVADLAAVIEQDAVISGKLTSVANSPLYRGAEQVASIGSAVARLGHNETQLIVGTLASRSLYDFEEPRYQDLAMTLWQHSLASAYLSRLLAGELGLGAGERYYALGLMHDIGKVLLLHSAAELMKKARTSDFDTIAVEDTLVAIEDHHNSFGAALLKRWRFTPVFSEVAEMHDRRNLNAASAVEVRVVALASNAANVLGYGKRPAAELDLLALVTAFDLKLDQAALERLAQETARLMKASLELL